MVKKAVILNETDLIDNIIKFNEPGKESSGFSEVAETISGQLTLKERLRAVEKDIFVEMLKKRPTTRQIAQALGIDHSTVVRKLKTHGLSTLAGVK
jgi:TyrR family helix-turn-helix protein